MNRITDEFVSKLNTSLTRFPLGKATQGSRLGSQAPKGRRVEGGKSKIRPVAPKPSQRWPPLATLIALRHYRKMVIAALKKL